MRETEVVTEALVLGFGGSVLALQVGEVDGEAADELFFACAEGLLAGMKD